MRPTVDSLCRGGLRLLCQCVFSGKRKMSSLVVTKTKSRSVIENMLDEESSSMSYRVRLGPDVDLSKSVQWFGLHAFI
jgi:hypothetical protein